MKRSDLARIIVSAGIVSLLLPGLAWAQSVFTHAHYRVPEGQQAQAAEWYNPRARPVNRERSARVRAFAIQTALSAPCPNEGMAGDGAVNVLDHVGISVPDVQAAVDLIREIGGEIRTEPQVGVYRTGDRPCHGPLGRTLRTAGRSRISGYQPHACLRLGCGRNTGLVPAGIRR